MPLGKRLSILNYSTGGAQWPRPAEGERGGCMRGAVDVVSLI